VSVIKRISMMIMMMTGAPSAPPDIEHSGTLQTILEGAEPAGTRGSVVEGGGGLRGARWWVAAIGFDGAVCTHPRFFDEQLDSAVGSIDHVRGSGNWHLTSITL